MSGSAFGPGLSLLGAWSDAGGCIGNESSIAVCKYTTSVSCSSNQHAGVTCYNSKQHLHRDMWMPCIETCKALVSPSDLNCILYLIEEGDIVHYFTVMYSINTPALLFKTISPSNIYNYRPVASSDYKFCEFLHS